MNGLLISDPLISGGSCSEHAIPAQAPEPDFKNTLKDGYFECGELSPRTTIDLPGVSSTGSGSITLSASGSTAEITSENSLNALAVEVFPQAVFERHSGIRLYLHNGELRVAEQHFRQQNEVRETIVRHKVDWGVYNGSIVFSVELASASQSSFEGGTFEFIGSQNPNDLEFKGMDILTKGLVFHDIDNSGALDAADEIAQIVAGNISISGRPPMWSISVDVQLDSSETISGYFNGDYIEIPLSDAGSLR